LVSPGVVPEVSSRPEPIPSAASDPSYRLTASAADAASAIESVTMEMPDPGARIAFVSVVELPFE